MTPTTAARFWSRVSCGDGCWEYPGASVKGGYRSVKVHQRRVLAHRFAWENMNGPVPGGLIVMHTCDNPPCVRPDHLRLGTQLDNIGDMVAKGRNRTGGAKTAGSANGQAKLTPDQVRAIRSAYLPRVRSLSMLAREFGVSVSSVHEIVSGRRWRTIEEDAS